MDAPWFRSSKSWVAFVEQPGDLQAELQREQELLQQLSVHRGEQRENPEQIPEERGREGVPELVEDPDVPDEPLQRRWSRSLMYGTNSGKRQLRIGRM